MTKIQKYFHRTGQLQAEQILQQGFKDESETYQSDSGWRGTRVSDSPTGAPRGFGKAVIEVEMLEEEANKYYWGAEQGYREYLIPAAVLNLYPRRVMPS